MNMLKSKVSGRIDSRREGEVFSEYTQYQVVLWDVAIQIIP